MGDVLLSRWVTKGKKKKKKEDASRQCIFCITADRECYPERVWVDNISSEHL